MPRRRTEQISKMGSSLIFFFFFFLMIRRPPRSTPLSLHDALPIYCGLAGFQQRRQRRTWFAGFWICAALACLTKGPHGMILPGTTFVVLAVCYHEARMRFRSLL